MHTTGESNEARVNVLDVALPLFLHPVTSSFAELV